MGLEVTAYSKVRWFAGDVREEAVFFIDEDSISRWPLTSVGLTPGAYQSTGAEFDVRIGHLMSYMWWREQLAQLGGYSQQDVLMGKITEGPFVELISFADLHGVIGNAAARKLADDFELHDAQAQALGSSFYGLYTQFKRVFQFAKETGVVSIH